MRRKNWFALIALLLIAVPAAGSLSVLTLPSGLTAIRAGAFAGDGLLTDVVVRGSQFLVEAGAFDGCDSLSALHVLSGDGDTLAGFLEEVPSLRYVAAPGGSAAYESALGDGTLTDIRRSDRRPRALVIYQTYRNTDELKTLTGPTNDAAAVYRMLKQWGFDVRKYGAWTAAEMSAQIRAMGASSEDGDITFIYFSGHGRPNGSLMGSDGAELTLAELTDAVATIRGRKIIAVDACYSGRLIDDGEKAASGALTLSVRKTAAVQKTEEDIVADDPEAFPEQFTSNFLAGFMPSVQKSGPRRAPTQLARDTGNYVMAAARYDQESWEAVLSKTVDGETFSKQMGFFTYYLCSGLGWDGVADREKAEASDADKDGRISFNEAFEYARNQVANDPSLKQKGLVQSAQASPAEEEGFTPFWRLPYTIE